MNRGGPLPRYTALVAKTPLRRTSWLRRSSKSGAGSGTTGEGGSVVSSAGRPRATRHVLPADVSKLVEERSKGWCEIGLSFCRGRATQKHHRITQKMGGRHGAAKPRSDRPSNLLHVCDLCHAVVTDRVWIDVAGDPYNTGWSLRERQEPTAEPVLYRGDLVYLTDGGDVVSFEKAGA